VAPGIDQLPQKQGARRQVGNDAVRGEKDHVKLAEEGRDAIILAPLSNDRRARVSYAEVRETHSYLCLGRSRPLRQLQAGYCR
jgi:hypothetical protein